MLKIKCSESEKLMGIDNPIISMLFGAMKGSFIDENNGILYIENIQFNKNWTPKNYFLQKHNVNIDEFGIIYEEDYQYCLIWEDASGYIRPQTIRFSIYATQKESE